MWNWCLPLSRWNATENNSIISCVRNISEPPRSVFYCNTASNGLASPCIIATAKVKAVVVGWQEWLAYHYKIVQEIKFGYVLNSQMCVKANSTLVGNVPIARPTQSLCFVWFELLNRVVVVSLGCYWHCLWRALGMQITSSTNLPTHSQELFLLDIPARSTLRCMFSLCKTDALKLAATRPVSLIKLCGTGMPSPRRSTSIRPFVCKIRHE
jgi:hypothetical protein